LVRSQGAYPFFAGRRFGRSNRAFAGPCALPAEQAFDLTTLQNSVILQPPTRMHA
jgi:hypothetical protein